MCRGLEGSAKYASRSASLSLRPNQVGYQNRKGNGTSGRANSVTNRYARRPGRLWVRGGLGDMRDSSYTRARGARQTRRDGNYLADGEPAPVDPAVLPLPPPGRA